MRYFAVIALLVIALTQPVAMQSFKPGYVAGRMAAWVREDYPTALKHFRPLAEQGKKHAQADLGVLYRDGLGFTKDYKAAGRK